MSNGTAADALDAIQQGGGRMLLSAYQRLAECRGHIEQGHFEAALVAASQVVDRLRHLNHAQQHLGALARAAVVKVAELQPGMSTDGNVVASVERCPCPQPGCTKRLITFEGGTQAALEADWETLVEDGCR